MNPVTFSQMVFSDEEEDSNSDLSSANLIAMANNISNKTLPNSRATNTKNIDQLRHMISKKIDKQYNFSL
jgi:hypothetical protein